MILCYVHVNSAKKKFSSPPFVYLTLPPIELPGGAIEVVIPTIASNSRPEVDVQNSWVRGALRPD